MKIRSYIQRDLAPLTELTIETFGPFYEGSFRLVVGETVFANQHGDWRNDYRKQLSNLYDPGNNKFVAVAEIDDSIVGYVAWNVDLQRSQGAIDIVAVSVKHRGQHTGTALCEHAFADMKLRGVEVVTIGTGGDPFHAPARALYESLGCTHFPVAVYYKQLQPHSVGA
ncbi:MAG: GNAT family N-acetyltransferase [Candidatus Nanopelagicales bacterium]